MDNFANISRFTWQTMTVCRVLSKPIVNIFILNLKFRPPRESESEKHVPLCLGFAFCFICVISWRCYAPYGCPYVILLIGVPLLVMVLLWELNCTYSLGNQNRKYIVYAETNWTITRSRVRSVNLFPQVKETSLLMHVLLSTLFANF